MAELKNTYVNGNLAARKFYEGGTAIENKYGASLGISGSTLQLKDATGTVISSTELPSAAGLNVTSVSGSSVVSVGTLSSGYYPIIVSNMTVKGKHTTAGYSTTSTEYTDSDVDSMTVGKIAAGSCTVAGGGLTKGTASGGGLSGGGLSGGGLTITSNYSGTPTVDITLDAQTTTGITITDTKPSSGYYLTIGASSSALSGKTKATRAAVTRAKIDRAAFSQTVTRAAITDTHTAGYIPTKSATTVIDSTSSTVSLAAGSIAADSTTIGSTYVEPTVTVNKGTKTEYIVIPSAVLTSEGSVSTAPSITIGGTTNMKTSSTDTGYYFTRTGAVGQTGSVQTKYKVTTAGYTPTKSATNGGTVSVTPGYTGNGTVYIQKGTPTATKGTASASVSLTGITATSSSATDYKITATASATGGSASVTEGYNIAASANGTNASDSETVYLAKAKATATGGSATASVSKNPSASASCTANGFTASSTATEYYVIASASSASGIATASATGGSASVTAGYNPSGASATGSSDSATSTEKTASDSKTIYIPKGTITANTPTVTPTHGAVTPSVGGTVTSVATTTKPSSGTDGTDYLTIDPGASITTQPKATPTYTYSATAGYTPAVSSTTKTGSATNITPSVNAGTNYYLPKKTPSFDGGGLTVPNPTVTLTKGTDTDGTGNITSELTDNGTTEPTSGYYVAIKGTASAITATRAATLYNGAVNGWVNVADNTTALSSTTKSNSAVSATEYFKIPSATLTLSAHASGSVREFTIADDGVVTCYADITGEAQSDDFDAGWLGSAPTAATYDATASLSGTVATTSVTPSASLATLTSAGSSATTVNSRYFKVTPSYSAANKGWLATTSGNGTVQNYTVRAASDYNFSITNQGNITVTVGSENTNSSGSGYYPLQTSLTGTLTANTPGWFSSRAESDADVIVGRIAKGSITNNTSGGTSSGTINRGSQIKIGAGYYPNDIYYTASTSIPSGYIQPSGNIKLTASSGTDVTNYATASVRSASGYGLAITNKGSTTVTVGSENTNSSGSGYYPLTASLTGTLSASTAGWFSSGSATDSSVVVGRIAKGSITNNTSGGSSTATISRGKQIKIGAGYYPNNIYYTAQSNSGTKSITSNGSWSVDGYKTATVEVYNIPENSAYLLGATNNSNLVENQIFGLHLEGPDCADNVTFINVNVLASRSSSDGNYASFLLKAVMNSMNGGGSGEYYWSVSFEDFYASGKVVYPEDDD